MRGRSLRDERAAWQMTYEDRHNPVWNTLGCRILIEGPDDAILPDASRSGHPGDLINGSALFASY